MITTQVHFKGILKNVNITLDNRGTYTVEEINPGSTPNSFSIFSFKFNNETGKPIFQNPREPEIVVLLVVEYKNVFDQIEHLIKDMKPEIMETIPQIYYYYFASYKKIKTDKSREVSIIYTTSYYKEINPLSDAEIKSGILLTNQEEGVIVIIETIKEITEQEYQEGIK